MSISLHLCASDLLFVSGTKLAYLTGGKANLLKMTNFTNLEEMRGL